MARLLLTLIVVAVTVYAFIDCLRSDDDEAQHLPRPVWLLVTLVPLVGGVAWLTFGRVRDSLPPVGAAAPRTVAPDDDPEFLRSLDRWRRRESRQEPPRAEPAADPGDTTPGPAGEAPGPGTAPEQPHRGDSADGD